MYSPYIRYGETAHNSVAIHSDFFLPAEYFVKLYQRIHIHKLFSNLNFRVATQAAIMLNVFDLSLTKG